MAYTVSLSNRFKKDFRRCIKRGLNMKHITDAMGKNIRRDIPPMPRRFRSRSRFPA